MPRDASLRITMQGDELEFYVDSHCQVMLSRVEEDRLRRWLIARTDFGPVVHSLELKARRQ
jgi:hypothetical protein